MVNEDTFIKILQDKYTAFACKVDLKIGGMHCITSSH